MTDNKRRYQIEFLINESGQPVEVTEIEEGRTAREAISALKERYDGDIARTQEVWQLDE